jgi:SdpC family antimicrobial peptide
MKGSAPQSESKHQQRATAFRRLSCGVVVVLGVALAVSFINRVYSVPEPVQARPYDGVTLYRGLFFASGPVAGKIPSIGKVASYLPAEYKNLEGQIIKYIQGKDPNYFVGFAKEIQSGDRVRVAAAIKKTNKLHREALIETTKNSNTQFASQVRRLKDQPEPEPETAKDVATIVCLYVPIVVGSAVATKAPPNELKGLSFERYVDEIVRTVPKT